MNLSINTEDRPDLYKLLTCTCLVPSCFSKYALKLNWVWMIQDGRGRGYGIDLVVTDHQQYWQTKEKNNSCDTLNSSYCNHFVCNLCPVDEMN